MASPKMSKVSRPVVYTALGALVVGAIFYLTQPDTPTTHHTVRRTVVQTADSSDGITAADLDAHFPRYRPLGRDPFVPNVASGQQTGMLGTSKSRGSWALTGVNTVDGVPSALVENAATGDSVFLTPGDRWNGLRVIAVNPDSVEFVNALGQQTSLSFPVPPDITAPGGTTLPGSTVTPPSPVPSLSQIQPLPALDPPARVGRRRRSYAAADQSAPDDSEQQDESTNQ